MQAVERKEDLADRIVQRMRDLGMTVPELSQISGVPSTTIRGLLSRAQRDITQYKLYRIAKALQTTMEWLTIGGAKQRSADQLDELLSAGEAALVRQYRRCKEPQKRFLEKLLQVFPLLPKRGLPPLD